MPLGIGLSRPGNILGLLLREGFVLGNKENGIGDYVRGIGEEICGKKRRFWQEFYLHQGIPS